MNRPTAERIFRAIAIGGSSGSTRALKQLLPLFCDPAGPAVIVVVHRVTGTGSDLEASFDAVCRLPVRQASEKAPVRCGTIYFAPPGYHLLVEDEATFALSADPVVNHARPSIDVTFESAADAFASDLAGVILTGANRDGSLGLKRIKSAGGLAVVQTPATAEMPSMPQAAISTAAPDRVLPLERLGPYLAQLPGPGAVATASPIASGGKGTP